MTALALLHKEITASVRRSGGLSIVDYRILLKAGEAGGNHRIGKIAAALGVGASAATQAVDTLEARGLVGRAASHEDGRRTLVGLTDAGRRLVRSTDEAVASDLARLWGDDASIGIAAPYRAEILAIGATLEGEAGSGGTGELTPSAYITSIEQAHRDAAQVVRSAAGGTFSEMRVLQLLADQDGRAPIAELVATLLLPSSTAANIFDRLTARGWATRDRPGAGVRALHLELSEQGRSALRLMREALDEYGWRSLWQQLDPEQAATTYAAALRLTTRAQGQSSAWLRRPR